MVIAGQQRQHGVVAGAEAAVVFPADHHDLLVLRAGQHAVPGGLLQRCAASVRAGVVHQIEGQRVAAGMIQHRLCGTDRLFTAIIGYDTRG